MAARRSSAAASAPRSMKIRSGDQVKVIAGKDRGKTGRVLRTEPRRQRVFVEGLNMVKRHTKPQQVSGTGASAAGGVIEREGPVHVSNVMLLDPKDNKPTRVGIEREGGKAFRVSRRSGTRID
jgi:large subunit ribosomal protein L24